MVIFGDPENLNVQNFLACEVRPPILKTFVYVPASRKLYSLKMSVLRFKGFHLRVENTRTNDFKVSHSYYQKYCRKIITFLWIPLNVAFCNRLLIITFSVYLWYEYFH